MPAFDNLIDAAIERQVRIDRDKEASRRRKKGDENYIPDTGLKLPAYDAEPKNWDPVAVVLPVNEVTCEGCNESYTRPGPVVLYEYANTVNRSTHWTTSRRLYQADVMDELPRKTHIKQSTVQRCPGCFEELELPEPRETAQDEKAPEVKEQDDSGT